MGIKKVLSTLIAAFISITAIPFNAVSADTAVYHKSIEMLRYVLTVTDTSYPKKGLMKNTVLIHHHRIS